MFGHGVAKLRKARSGVRLKRDGEKQRARPLVPEYENIPEKSMLHKQMALWISAFRGGGQKWDRARVQGRGGERRRSRAAVFFPGKTAGYRRGRGSPKARQRRTEQDGPGGWTRF